MKLFVGNLSFHTAEGTLEEVFSEFGTVSDVHLVMDRVTQRSRGFAFVTMSTEDEARRAMESLNGKQIDGRAVAVSEARPQEPRPPRGEHGGGGGGGGYRDRGDRGDRGGGDRGERRGGGDRRGDGGGGGYRRR